MKADLHCHSTFSDGTLTPKQLVALALENGIEGLSITDHDTVAAYSELTKEAKKSNLRIISGAEFSSAHQDCPIHILAYSFKLDHPKIVSLIAFHKTRRIERNEQILKNLTKQGLSLTLDEIREILPHMSHQIGRAHIAYSLFKKGLITTPQEAFTKWIGEGKPCYAPSSHPTITETIDIIHEAGGFAVIAHPHLVKKKPILRAIVRMPFDGIEARYALFQQPANQRYLDIAKDRKMLITGGSDFHGEIRPHNPLGASTTDEIVFSLLEKRFLENN